MAEAVAEAVDDGTHLLVQAGTGTGKSLGYLVPALAHGERVVVATATLALQRQLVERDLPRTVEALHPLLRRRPEFAMLKGRSNYLCLHRLHEGVPQDEEDGLFDPFEAAAPTSQARQGPAAAARLVGRDRDRRPGRPAARRLRPCLVARSPSPRGSAWAPPSARTARSASPRRPGSAPSWPRSSSPTTRCSPSTRSRAPPCCPPHEVLIVDEAHELVSRVTGVATGELTPGGVNRAVRRAAKLVDEKTADRLQTAAETFERLMELALPGRLEDGPGGPRLRADGAARRRARLHHGPRQHPRQVRPGRGRGAQAGPGRDGERARRRRTGRRGLRVRRDLVRAARPLRRLAAGRAAVRLGAAAREAVRRPLRGPHLRHAQAGRRLQRRRRLARPRPRARARGRFTRRRGRGRGGGHPAVEGPGRRLARSTTASRASSTSPGIWRRPAGTASARDMLDELAELVEAAGGRTLGLFSSMRAAQAAAEDAARPARRRRSCCRARRPWAS